ncbi:MAG: hypothetical protein PHZ02_03360 [Desulfocapsaceae bacterium]|nr:hypothetical protein [Desulfocapsaceae bacterium]
MTSGKKAGLFQQFLLRLPLKTIFLVSTGIAILLLTVVTILSVKQYILYQHCEQVVTASRQLLFEFSTIKEHINETLITQKKIQFKDILGEIEELEADIALIRNDILIPEEFKQGFISQIDLVGLVVKLRAVQEAIDTASSEQLSALTALLRSMFGRVSQFDQGLSSYTQTLLLGLHKTLVGSLALVIFVVSTLLFLINRSITNPILQMGHQVRSINDKNTDLQIEQKTNLDVSVNEIINTVTTLAAEHLRLSHICNAIALYETLEKNSTSPTERWQDICSVLQVNADYCLVWVGTLIQDKELPQPVSACGCLSASKEGCLDILDHLLKYCKTAGGLCDSVSKAIQTKTATVSRLFTSSLPESLRNLLPFSDDTFSSASFPVPSQDEIPTIITLYNPGHHCFSSREMTLLSYFFNHLMHDNINDSPPNLTSIPETLLSFETLSKLYRYSTLGSLTTGLAHELTDLSNGAINYTQALLDLIDEQGQLSEVATLLQKLLKEEKKISRLTVELQQLARDNSEENRQYTVQEIIEPIINLTKGQTKTEGIELHIKIAPDLPVISKNGKNIQFVLLSLIQNARSRILTKYPVCNHERKQIRIAAILTQQTGRNRLLITIQDHGTAWQSPDPGQNNSGPAPESWPELPQCKLFVENFGGDLVVESGSEQQNISTVVFPC